MTTEPREAVLRILEHYNFSIWQEKRHEIADALFAAGLIRDEAEIASAAKICHELGKAEGRKEAGEEIAQAIESQVGDGEWAGDYYRKAAQIAREVASQQNYAAPDGLTDAPVPPRTPDDSQALSIRIPGGEG